MMIRKNSDVGSLARCIFFEEHPSVILASPQKRPLVKLRRCLSYDCLCRFEACFMGFGSVDDNGVTKFEEVVSHGSVESDFVLLD